jgi:hypothetical protein
MKALKTCTILICFDTLNKEKALKTVKRFIKKGYYQSREQLPTENENTGYFELSKQDYKTK